MNNENKIDLSIEMYEDLKETLVKTIKNAKAGGAGNAGLDNVQLERIERLIEAAELSQGQVAQLLEHLQRHTALPGVQHTAGAVGRETGGDRQGEQEDTYIDRTGRESCRGSGNARKPARAGAPAYLYARS